MYKKVKKLLLKLFPGEWTIKNEFILRKIYSLFFIGKSVYCNICKRHYSNFIDIFEDKLCPGCGSLARHRRLWQIITGEYTFNKNDRILDFSPSRIMLKKLKKGYSNYTSTDFTKNPLVDKRYDITSLPESSGSFDWIICYHVLEHVENDQKAFSELYRILKKGGSIFIQTPFKEGNIYENPLIVSKEDRLKHFGQEDHVRIYSVHGLKERLQHAGFNVKVLEYTEEFNNINGFKQTEYVFIALK